MPRRMLACTLIVLISSFVIPPQVVPARDRGVRTPSLFHVVRRHTVAPGLTHLTLRKTKGPDQTVHVARLAPRSKLRIQPVPSRGNATGRGPLLEKTSRLCRRVDCLVAVNGDFYRGGRPVGGLVLDGRPVRPFRARWAQAVFDGDRRLVTRRVKIRATLMSSDLRKVAIGHIDPRYPRKGLSLYTSASGRRTPKRRSVEAIFRAIDPRGPLRIGQSSVVRLAGIRQGKGRTKIPERGMVLSARGPAAKVIKGLRSRARSRSITPHVLVRLRSNADLWNTVGGRPVIVRDGRSVVRPTRDSFARARHPRTLVGRARDGSVLLVTVDGRSRHRTGMSLREAARMMIRLGAVEAINLDGGGSTTFVERGRVRNRPGDGFQRRVAVALAVVRTSQGVAGPRTPGLAPLAQAQPAKARPTPSVAPSTALPAIVAEPRTQTSPSRLPPFAGVALVTSLGLYGRSRRTRSKRS